MTQRRRILVLTPRDPYPLIGGDRLRIHRLARELARHYDLTLLTLCRTEKQRRAPLPDDGVFTSVHRVVLPRWRSLLNAAAALPFARTPLQVAFYQSAPFRRAVEELAPDHDAVLAHLARTAPYAENLPMVRVLEMTDAISMSMERVSSTRLGYFDFRRLVYQIEAKRLGAYERDALTKFDVVGLNSAADRSFLYNSRKSGHAHVMVIPNGTDAPKDLPLPQAQRTPGDIVFIGNLQSLQNFDAVWFFARHALPLVLQKRPDVRLRIIGCVRPGALMRLAALPGVLVEGFVPSIERAIERARIGICPTRVGSGMQNKVLDYLGNRLAVVCSPNALQGIDARADEHLLTADTPEQWASQILRLLDDEALAQRLADAGRELVTRRYRWDRCVFPLIGVLDSLLSRQVLQAAPAIEQTIPQLTAPSWPTTSLPEQRSRSSGT